MKKIKMKFGEFYIRLLNSCKKVSGRLFEYKGVHFGIEKKNWFKNRSEPHYYALTHIKTGLLLQKYDRLTDLKNDLDHILQQINKEDSKIIQKNAKKLEELLFKVYKGEIDEKTGKYTVCEEMQAC